jgi:hypothetical protein
MIFSHMSAFRKPVEGRPGFRVRLSAEIAETELGGLPDQAGALARLDSLLRRQPFRIIVIGFSSIS